jgi:hypothetical protein
VRFDLSWSGRRRRVRGAPGPAGQAQQAVREMLDPYDQRASVSDGDRTLIEPGKVLANIALAMERVDIDISTTVSIEDDVASAGELMSLAQIGFGASLTVHVAKPPCRSCRLAIPPTWSAGPCPTSSTCAS